ncbi:hypothetical protein C4588_03995 [Candidatus Parcubacteria bacterium]|nr:MAG: hypothetical protein C4588_03995 [Candidatus Parcubacteria bacterium]
MSLDNLFSSLKARGNWGHGGRPGKRGGSLPKSGSAGGLIPKPGGIEGAITNIKKAVGGKLSEAMASSTASGRIALPGNQRAKVEDHLNSQGYNKTLDRENRSFWVSSKEPHGINVETAGDSTEVQAYYLKDWRG